MNQQTDKSLGAVLSRLAAKIEARRAADPGRSYTAKLLAGGREACAKKFGEEAVEAIIAGSAGDAKALTAEAADTLYHLLVLLAANKVTIDQVAQELHRREGQSGHDEKASR